jgi:hypothetical protein
MKKLLFTFALFTFAAITAADEIVVFDAASFIQAINKDVQNGDVITFGLPAEANNTIDLARATKINIKVAENTAVIVDGATLDGKRTILTNSVPTTEEFFNYAGSTVVDGASLTFRNLIIKDFVMTGRSGLLRSGNSSWATAGKQYQITFENVTFIGLKQNTPAAADGFFDLRQGTNITYKNCSFINNSMTPTQPHASGKKTMFALNSAIVGLNLINCTFYGNNFHNDYNTFMVNNAGVNTNIINCSFIKNTAAMGVMQIFKRKDYANLVNSLFAYNRATGEVQSAVDFQAGTISEDGLNTVTDEATVAYCAFNVANAIIANAVGLTTNTDFDQTTLFATYANEYPVLNENTYTVSLARNLPGTGAFGGVEIPGNDQNGTARNLTSPTIGAVEYVVSGIQNKHIPLRNVFVSDNKLIIQDEGDGAYSIFNTTGQLLKSGMYQNSTYVNIGDLTAGLYIISINNKSAVFIK